MFQNRDNLKISQSLTSTSYPVRSQVASPVLLLNPILARALIRQAALKANRALSTPKSQSSLWSETAMATTIAKTHRTAPISGASQVEDQ